MHRFVSIAAERQGSFSIALSALSSPASSVREEMSEQMKVKGENTFPAFLVCFFIVLVAG